MTADYDISPRRPVQLGIATGSDIEWVTPADPIRVRGADLGEVARRTSAVRRDHPDADVVVDIEVVIAADARSARAMVPANLGSPGTPTMLYVGTPAGLAGLIADIHALGIADGAVLIPRKDGQTGLIADAVLPVLTTMTCLPA
ncbi:MAG: hypothetical protein ACR2JM_14505 [Mycobacterium sp.]